MKFPLEVYLEDTSKDQVNGLRVAIAKDNRALKALKAGGYVVEKPKAEKEPKETKEPKPKSKASK